MITGATEMPIVGDAFLCAVSRAFARIHIEHDDPRLTPLVHRVDPLAWADRQERRGFPAPPATRSRSGPSGWPRQPDPWGALPPTTQRTAGSRHNRSASFTSS